MDVCRLSYVEMGFFFGIGVIVGGIIVGTMGRWWRRHVKGRWP